MLWSGLEPQRAGHCQQWSLSLTHACCRSEGNVRLACMHRRGVVKHVEFFCLTRARVCVCHVARTLRRPSLTRSRRTATLLRLSWHRCSARAASFRLSTRLRPPACRQACACACGVSEGATDKSRRAHAAMEMMMHAFAPLGMHAHIAGRAALRMHALW